MYNNNNNKKTSNDSLLSIATLLCTAVVLLLALSSSATALHQQENQQPPADDEGQSSQWLLVNVREDGSAEILAERLVAGTPSECNGDSVLTSRHADRYVALTYTSSSLNMDKDLSSNSLSGQQRPVKCVVGIQDPRIHFVEHHHHGNEDSDHMVQKTSGTFAVRVPLDARDLVLTAMTLSTNGKEKTKTVLAVDKDIHSVRRTANTLGTTVWTIPTSQLSMTRLQEVGDPNEQFNIIFVSSGYNGNDREGYFRRDVDDTINFLSGATQGPAPSTPFDIYYPLFNVYRVWMSSDEAGATKPGVATVQNNLDCAYGVGASSSVLECNRAKALLAASYAPADPLKSVVIVLVYDTQEGGSGGSHIAVFASQAPNRFGTLLHQLGHAISGTSDEYSYGSPETMQVPMKNCHWLSYNTPWQSFTNARVVNRTEDNLGCTFSNYYAPTKGNCIMASTSSPSGFCPVCRYYMLQAWYNGGVKLASPTYPLRRERAYAAPGQAVPLMINSAVPLMIKPSDNTVRFEVSWTIVYPWIQDVGFQTSTYNFSSFIPGDYIINVTIKDKTTIILDSDRQYYEQRGGNGPTSLIQMYSFRVTVTNTVGASGCTTKSSPTALTMTYCGVCDAGATCSYSAQALPLTSITTTSADLQGLEVWMVAIGIVFVVVGIVIFIVAWRVMNIHQENNPSEILPLTENILIIRGVLIGVQLLVLIIATFTIIYCVYQYGQLTVFGQSILLGVIACAVVVWFGSYVGVVAAYYKSRSLLFVNFILLLLLFGCVLLFSILLVYVLTNVTNSGVIDQLQSEWQTAVANRGQAVCDVESALQCSGFNTSCSGFSATSTGGSTYCPAHCGANNYSNPCLPYVQDFVRSHFGAASAGGWVLTSLLLIALILSVLLGCAIKNRRNVVHRERRVRHATGQNILLPEEIALLRKEFNKIDKDGSGDISREEFSLFYNAVMGTDLSPRELEEYFDKLDADGNGNLSFEEFLKVYVPHREPRRKSMVKPKNVVELSSSSSSSDSEDSVVQQQQQPLPGGARKAAYEQQPQFEDDFAFEAPKKTAANAPPKQGGGLNVSQSSSVPPQRQQQNFTASTPQNADLKTSYQSNRSSDAAAGGGGGGGVGRAAAPPPRQQYGGGNSNGNSRNSRQQHDDFDLDIEMDDDFM